MNHTTKRIISQFRVLNMNLLRVMNEWLTYLLRFGGTHVLFVIEFVE